VRLHAVSVTVTNGAHQDIDAFKAANGVFDLGEQLVAAHRVCSREPALRLAGANHIDAIELGLAFNLLLAARIGNRANTSTNQRLTLRLARKTGGNSGLKRPRLSRCVARDSFETSV